MSLQVKSIVLYNRNGERREVKFRLNQVNIITGESKTGKSSIIDIIEYCLGRDKFEVSAGVVADNVEWYGVLFQLHEAEIFVAKPKPKKGRKEQSEAYYEIAARIEIPPLEVLVPNSNDDAVNRDISRRLGISTDFSTSRDGDTRPSIEASLAQAKLLLFQPQGVIADKTRLFYRQDHFIAQHIRATLPYFLGATQEDRLRLNRDIENKRRQLRVLERQLDETTDAVDQRVYRGQALIAEAQQVGLIGADVEASTVQDTVAVLAPIRDWQPALVPPVPNDLVEAKLKDLSELRRDFRDTREKIQVAEDFISHSTGFMEEATAQRERLESINLYDPDVDLDQACPFCGSPLRPGAVSSQAIARSLRQLQAEIGEVTRERPHLDAHIGHLQQGLESTRQLIQQKEFEVQALLNEQVDTESFKETNARIARVVGRVTFFLDITPLTIDEEAESLHAQIDRLQTEIDALNAELSRAEDESRVTSALNIVGHQMTEMARVLELEYDAPYRFDLKKLTVIADRPNGPVEMRLMGSAANHLGCHLIAHLALHTHFIAEQRPVPKFLVLDQATQVYFPPDRDIDPDYFNVEANDQDRDAVRRIFDLLFRVSRETGLQIIVLEHANLSSPEFQEAIVENWRDGNALVPDNWITS